MSQALSVNEAMGSWRLEGPDAGRRCSLALSGLGGPPRWQALAENCVGTPYDAARGWRPVSDGVEVLGDGDQIIGRFRQAGVDGFVSDDGLWRLARAPLS